MTSTGQQPKNILWISLEDTSPRMGCYGDSLARTPHIDMLASEGTLFRNAFATAGVCAPSRSAVITGMYATAIGAHHMRTAHTNKQTPELPTPYETVPPPHVKLIPEMLRANGYYCTNSWKTDYQFQAPLTAWDENGTEAHWRNRKPGQPFFAVFNYDLTHESRMWSAESLKILGGLYDEESRKQVARNKKFPISALEEKPTITDPDEVVLPPYLPDTSETRKALARHYDNLADADAFVGQILEQLEEDGLSGDTIIMLWSDHGEGLPRAKRWTYDAGIRVPLIVRWPGKAKSGDISHQLISLIDLGPTVLTIAGIPVPRHLQGKSFIGENAEPRDYIFATRDRYDEAYDKVRAVRDIRFKYIRNDYPDQPYLQWIPFSHLHPAFRELRRLQLAGKLEGAQQVLLQTRRPPEELYDCELDPYELNNLAEEPAFREQLLRLRNELDSWCDRYDRWGDVPEDRMVELMWPNRIQPQTVKPLFIPINQELPGMMASIDGTFNETTSIMLHTPTQGASIAYTFDETPNPLWKLYTGPILISKGSTRIRAIAVRIGYKDSEVTEAAFVMN